MSARTRRLSFALATVAAFLALWLAIAAHPWTGPATRPVDPRLTALAARERRLQHEAGQVQRLLAKRWSVYDGRLRRRTRQIALARAAYRRQLAAARLREQQNAAALAARAASERSATLVSRTSAAANVPATVTPTVTQPASTATAPAAAPAPAPAAPPKVVVVTVPAVTTSTSSKP